MTRAPEPYDLADTGQRPGPSMSTLPGDSQPLRPAAVLAGLALFAAVVAGGLVLVGWVTGWAGELVWRVMT